MKGDILNIIEWSVAAAATRGLTQVRVAVRELPTSRNIPHLVQILAILNCVDLLNQVLEDVPNIHVGHGTRLHE